MIALRFTTNTNETNLTSEDQVNKIQFNGLCAYDITSEVKRMIADDYTIEEAIKICALKQVKCDNWHAHNSKGSFVVFDADFVEYERDNQDFLGNRAVIVTINNYIAAGEINMISEYYKINSLTLI